MTRANLPQIATPFVGRERELRDLEVLIAGGARFVTITGLGGMGKSRLVIEFARAQMETGAFERICFVPLETTADAQDIPTRIASALELPIGGPETVMQALEHAFAGEHALLVLDNFDGLVEGAPLVSELLEACPALRVVTTSRQPLALAEERLLALDGLALPERVGDALERLERFDAVSLFAQRAKRSDVRFEVVAENAEGVVSVCRLVEGMPLAIELAAAWVRMMPPAEIADEIRSSIEFLTSTSRNVVDRHRSLRAVLDYAWRSVSDDERDAMSRLAVFDGGFSDDAASAVAGAEAVTLASLSASSLLRTASEGRYGMHALVQQYAREKLAERPTVREAVEELHAAYFSRFVEESVGLDDELARLDRDLTNVLAAMDRGASRGDASRLVALMRLLTVEGAYYAARGHTRRSLALLEAATTAAKESGELAAAHRLFAKLGDVYRLHHGMHDRALEAYREALDLAEQLADHERQTVMLSVIGQTRFAQGAEDADAFLQRAYELAREHDDALGLNHVLQHLGCHAGERGEWEAAHGLFSEALDVLEQADGVAPSRRADAAYQLFMALLNLGEAERMLGRLGRAMELRLRALAMAEERDNPLWKAMALKEVGEVHHGLNERLPAQEMFDQALELWTRHNVPVEAESLRTLMSQEGYLVPDGRDPWG